MKLDIGEFNIKIGEFKKGKNNSISDVAGVKVGHVTYDKGSSKTGITAILPTGDNLFKHKLVSASHIINGFGKSIGLIQVDELGTLETPILLTNTLSAGRVADGLIKYMLKDNKDIGRETSTINPLVFECNDGHLNDIQNMFLSEQDVFSAISNSKEIFQEGGVGAGCGMVSYGLKGGIGSSSRIINLGDRDYTIGVLVLSNFGQMEDLRIDGKKIGRVLKNKTKNLDLSHNKEDKGSIIVILATDLGLSHRQLKRLIKRSTHGIASTGSFTGNGSGEISLGFSTANIINHNEKSDTISLNVVNENNLNPIFKASKEATEEAILSSLFNGKTCIGRDGHKVYSLLDLLPNIKDYFI